MAAAPTDLQGVAGIWTLSTPADNSAPQQTSLHESTEESLFDPDFRTLVDSADYQDGGKYRSVVKLQMRYEGQTSGDQGWFMGTGWLVRPDLLATAGHNVYNWSGNDGEGLGKAVVIKCHIGYHGKESIGKPTVQSRQAKRIVTTAEWLTSKDKRNRDFAFIQVDRPFEGNLRLFTYKTTPTSANEMIGVVGYPGDKTIKDAEDRDERGALMWEEFSPVSFNLSEPHNPFKMLKYRISTFGGQSGAPVIRKGQQVSIGTHVYGQGDKNQASPIGVANGNDYDSFVSAFSQDYPKIGDISGIPLVRPGTSGVTVVQIGPQSVGANQPKSQIALSNPGLKLDSGVEAESIWDSLKSIGGVVAGIGKTVLPFASPLLGPLGGPVAAIGGAALGALGNACAESVLDEPPTPASINKAAQCTTERAILAEAALQACQAVHPSHPVAQKLKGEILNKYSALAPNVKLIAPRLAPGLALTVATLAHGNYLEKNQVPRRTAPVARPIHNLIGQSESFGEPNEFVDAMLNGGVKPMEGEEGFFDGLGPLFSKGLQWAKPLLRNGARLGLQALNNALAESASEESFTGPNDSVQAAETIAKRAIMAEAALQAVMKLNSSELHSVKVQGQDGGEEESFIDFIKGAAQKIGGVVTTFAPTVIKAVLPAVLNAATKRVGGAESTASNPAAFTGSTFDKTLQSQPSYPKLGLQVSAILGPRSTLESLEAERLKLRRVDSNEDLPVRED